MAVTVTAADQPLCSTCLAKSKNSVDRVLVNIDGQRSTIKDGYDLMREKLLAEISLNNDKEEEEEEGKEEEKEVEATTEIHEHCSPTAIIIK